MNIQEELTQAIAEAAKSVLSKSKKESLKDYKPTRGGTKQDDFIDLHTIDDKEDPEQKKQVEEKDVEEGNEFTKAAAKAKLAGDEEFEFDGKTYPVEISQDAAEKILGKSESVEELEEEVDNFFGFPTKDKLVQFQSMAKKLRIKPMSNPTVLKRGGKEFHVMGFKGSVKDIEKAMKAAAKIIKEETLEEAVDNFFGFPTKDKLVQFQSMAKKLRIKPISNPTVLKRGGKEFHVMGFEGSVSDIEKAMKVAADIIKEQKKTEEVEESVDGRTKEFKEKIKNLEYSKSQEEKDVEESTVEYAKSLEKIANDRKLKNISKKDKETLAKIADLLKRANEAISKTEKIEETLEEESVDEAIDPRRFVLGGNTKATKRDVDAILSKLFMNAKLAKQVEDSEAYKAGYKSKGKGKNPYKKDTADFQLYILGQQSAQSE